MKIKTPENMVTVSLIIPRADELNNKAEEVNDRLMKMCGDRNIPYIDHSNVIIPNIHLNEYKLHLNKQGVITLAESFSNFILDFV